MMGWHPQDMIAPIAMIPMMMTATTTNKQRSCTARKIQYYNFLKCTKTLAKNFMPFALIPLMHEAQSFPCLVYQWWQQHHKNNNHYQADKLTTSTDVMLFAWMLSITSFDAKDVHSDTSWMGCHSWCICENFWSVACAAHLWKALVCVDWSSCQWILSQPDPQNYSVENACADLHTISPCAP